jgi:hypothetical protein
LTRTKKGADLSMTRVNASASPDEVGTTTAETEIVLSRKGYDALVAMVGQRDPPFLSGELELYITCRLISVLSAEKEKLEAKASFLRKDLRRIVKEEADITAWQTEVKRDLQWLEFRTDSLLKENGLLASGLKERRG